ncbi:MAG: DUF1329 domain-containing protein [Myxococcota bacterium]|nr:DUF1329 domain-containing protein [Myxococcota bacterium]
MSPKTSIIGLSALCLGLLLAPAAGADVEPGDTVTFANREQVRGLIPDELFPFVADDFPELEMKIVATGDYAPHQVYVDATVQYACQANLDDKGLIQNYTAGQPFPYSEWAKEATGHKCDLTEDDPQFALKLAWNVNYRWQGGSGLNLPHWGFSNMRNRGKETWRIAEGEYRRTYFSHRADILPSGTHQLDEGTDVEWAEFFDVKTPFDLRGTMFLLYRYTTDKEDDTWAYVPALRRVRRIAATQKSDSLLGTEFTLEDFYIFAGYVWDHQWEFKGESVKLGPMNSKRVCFPSVISETEARKETGMTRLGNEKEWNHCSFGPYRALAFDGETWEKRTAFQLDDIPRQKGHPYSRKMIWYDKETMMPLYSMMYDRAGKPYRIINSIFKWSEDTPIRANKGKQVLNYSHIMVVNVQNDNSHAGQFDNANAVTFSVADSKKYYDTTKLKRRGR